MAAKADRPSTAHHRRRCQRGIRSLAVLTVRTHMYDDDGGGPRIPLRPGRAGGGFVYLNLPLMGSSAASNARCRQLQGPGFCLCHSSRPGAADKRPAGTLRYTAATEEDGQHGEQKKKLKPAFEASGSKGRPTVREAHSVRPGNRGEGRGWSLFTFNLQLPVLNSPVFPHTVRPRRGGLH
jgi:hypothetical protein